MLWPTCFTELIWQLHSSVFFSYYASQKKTLEINPKHPLVKQMLKRVNVSLTTVASLCLNCYNEVILCSF